MAVKIKLKRMGKVRNPQYRIIVADSRTKRDGRAIEEIGLYHPKEQPSLIRVDSARAQHWLSVGAQPTEPVLAILKITGDWQTFKGEPGGEGTLQVKQPGTDKSEVFAKVLADAHKGDEPEVPRRAPKAKAKAVQPEAAEAAEAAAPGEPAGAVADEAPATPAEADEPEQA